MVRRTALSAAVLLAVATALVWSPAQAATPAAPAERPRILVLGDSLVWEAVGPLQALARNAGVDLEVHAFGGLAPCDGLRDAEDGMRRDPQVVVASFSGNALTPCMRGATSGLALRDRYALDAGRLRQLTRGRPLVWVTPPASQKPNPAGDLAVAAIRWAASLDPGDTTVVDGGAHISPGGRWTATLPCLFFEPCPRSGTVVVRSPDGAHFCPTGKEPVLGVTDWCDVHSSGALRFALALLQPALAELDGR